ncbi:MAG: hypothetical protein ABWY11_03275 [Umezawaea sp.]
MVTGGEDSEDPTTRNEMQGEFGSATQAGRIVNFHQSQNDRRVVDHVPLIILGTLGIIGLAGIVVVALTPFSPSRPHDVADVGPSSTSVAATGRTLLTNEPRPISTCPDGRLRATGAAPAEVVEPAYTYTATINCGPANGQEYHLVIEYDSSVNKNFEHSEWYPQLETPVPPAGTVSINRKAEPPGSTRHLYVISCTSGEWAGWTDGFHQGEEILKRWPGSLASERTAVTRR